MESARSNAHLWKNAKIKAWFPLDVNAEQMVMNLATDFQLQKTPTFAIESQVYEEGNSSAWVDEMKKYLKAVEIGDTRIHFPWQNAKEGMINLELNPGSAFGTGEHVTTQLCMRWLQGVLEPGINVLDYGTGNGALAIRAAMHHYSVKAVGVDIDRSAVEEAKLNAVRNGVAENTAFFLTDDEPDAMYAVVLANILAPVLISLAPHIVQHLLPGGSIALSGILCSQAVEVASCYKRLGIDLTEGEVQSGWTILSGVKPST